MPDVSILEALALPASKLLNHVLSILLRACHHIGVLTAKLAKSCALRYYFASIYGMHAQCMLSH